LVNQSLEQHGDAKPFAAILMDANMPVMDGYAATKIILSTHGAMTPPIIALTASVMEEDRQRCLDAGMHGFLPKPLRMDELSDVLARFTLPANTTSSLACTVTSPNIHLAETSAEGLIDWGRLAQFKEFDDAALSMTREVIALFMHDAPERVEAIQHALRDCDSAALSLAAHALKGAASNVGAIHVAQACTELEQSCLQSQWPQDAAAQVAQIALLAEKTYALLSHSL
jgi:CheY-like chemotaxis protein